jgi:hypothetical protein
MRNGALLASTIYLPFALGLSGYTDDVGDVVERTAFHTPATTSKKMKSECFINS